MGDSFNPAVLTSKAISWPQDIDTVTIVRYATTVPGGVPTSTPTTIYSGAGDFQEGGGGIYYNPEGAVEEAEAKLFIDATPLPTFEVDDRVTYAGDGKTYAVVSVNYKPFAFPYIELLLKRGPGKDVQK